MCKCTPEIRTPFCGRPGCEWPEKSVSLPNKDVVKSIVSEIAAMEYAGDMKAIAAVIIDREGDVRTLVAYSDGHKITMIGGCSILSHQVISEARTFNKDRDSIPADLWQWTNMATNETQVQPSTWVPPSRDWQPPLPGWGGRIS